MVEKQITPKEFETYLQEFVGRDLTDFYYITDKILVFRAGKKYQYDETTTSKGEKKPMYHSEHELRIWGDWKYEKDGQVVETTDVNPGEDGPKFRLRIGDFSETIHPNKVTAIKVSEDGKETTIILDNGGQFVVTPSGDSYIDYDHRSFNANGTQTSNHGVRPEENTGELTYFEAP